MPTSNVLSRVNPFHVQWNSTYFVGRQDELRIFEQNLAGLKHGHQSHLVVAGVHGTGKSFYLNKLAEIAKSKNCVVALVDCSESTPIEQARSLIRDAIRQIQVQTVPNGSPVNTALSSDFDKKENSQLFSLPKRNDLTAGDLQDDFSLIAQKATTTGHDGLVVCIDEGQRITRQLLSCVKNALSRIAGIVVVLSWRLASDTKGAVNQARQELLDRVSDTEQDKDIGAAAFFSSATAMGPFKTDAEVAGYFAVRLRGNAIRFSNDVVSRLGDIANRVPRPMTELAHDVYDAATKMSLTDVDVLLLNECFRTRYPAVVKEATDLCADLSGETMTLLKALCRLSDSAVALEIVQNAFPGAPDLHHQLMAEGAGKILDSLCQSSVILRKTDQKYDIVDSFRRYALKLSLGVA